MAKTTTTKAKTKTTSKTAAPKKATAPKKVNAKASTKTTKSVTTKTKKPATKTVVKTEKVTKESAPKQAAVKASVSKTGSTTTPLLNRAHVLMGGLFTALAVAAGFFMNTASAQVLMGHLTKDELASSAGTVLAPAAHVLYQIEFRWLLVALLGVSAVIAILRGTRYFANEEAGIKNRLQPSRWIEFGITGAIAFEIVALLNGLQDVVAVKLGIVSILLAAYLAWVFERENAVTGKPSRAIYSASAVAILFPVLALIATMVSTYVYGMVRSPWYAYAAAAVVAVTLLVTIRMQASIAKKQSGAVGYYFVNRKYDIISAVSKIALAAILIAGLYE